jgi:hypothetical protein
MPPQRTAVEDGPGARGVDDWPAIDASTLPAQDVPFPVEAPFRVRPDLRKLSAEADAPDAGAVGTHAGRLLVLDERYPAYAREKSQRLGDPQRPLVLLSGPGGIQVQVLRGILERLEQAHPALLARSVAPGGERFDFATSGRTLDLRVGEPAAVRALASRPDARQIARRIAARPAGERALAALALSVQEDLVLMAQTGEGLVAQALCVALPSGWDPREKLGSALAQIHGPVADGDALRAASDNLARAMVEKGPYLRHVWSIADSGALARWPARPMPTAGVATDSTEASAARPGAGAAAGRGAPPGVGGLWFRCERQVTMPLPAWRSALFLVRVFVAPLASVAADDARRARIVESLRSMSDDVVKYKGLAAAREAVLREWGGA